MSSYGVSRYRLRVVAARPSRGALCGKTAHRDLRGGRPATGGSTSIAKKIMTLTPDDSSQQTAEDSFRDALAVYAALILKVDFPENQGGDREPVVRWFSERVLECDSLDDLMELMKKETNSACAFIRHANVMPGFFPHAKMEFPEDYRIEDYTDFKSVAEVMIHFYDQIEASYPEGITRYDLG